MPHCQYNGPPGTVTDSIAVDTPPIFIGLDLSLTATGFCMKCGCTVRIETIKTVPKGFPDDLARLIHITEEVHQRIPKAVCLICMEDFFMPSNPMQINAAIHLAMLGASVRMRLYQSGYPFFTVSPSILKKHITGKGVGQKSIVVREVYKKWGIDCKDDNQADACVLAHLAHDILLGDEELRKLPKYQQDTVARLRGGVVGKSYNFNNSLIL